MLFWAAFILTRPLGAVVGDFLDKPLDHGGLALSRYAATFALSAVIVALILVFRKGRRDGRIETRQTCVCSSSKTPSGSGATSVRR